jgi:hypothetical protein
MYRNNNNYEETILKQQSRKKEIVEILKAEKLDFRLHMLPNKTCFTLGKRNYRNGA